ncbi:hypothetical protein CC79DRAFT_1316475 [Sarocladium strictum]
MSTRYDGTPVQPPSPYRQLSPREFDVRGQGIKRGVSPPSSQSIRLPSLNSWVHAGPQSPILTADPRLSDPRVDERTAHPYPYQTPQAPQVPHPHFQPVNPELNTSRETTALFNQGPHVGEIIQPSMCFRGDSSSEPQHGEPRPRPVGRTTSRPSMAPPSYREYPSRPPSYYEAVPISKERPMVSSSRPETHYKRQASSPAPQVQPSKKSREQTPTTIRPRVRTRDVVPNLLGPDKAHLIQNMKFTLKIRQQPQQARSCGFADKDRRAIDPPPIVELKIDGDGLSKEDLDVYMNYDRYVMCCTLLDERGVDAMNMEQDGLRSKRMMGENTVVPFVGADEHGHVGCFFSFNDLSCRTPGDYRLSFSVSALPTMEESRAGVRYPRMTDITSDVFKAYNAKLFPGMTESSALARALKEQGCNISVRKGNEKTKSSRGRNAPRDDDDDEEDF